MDEKRGKINNLSCISAISAIGKSRKLEQTYCFPINFELPRHTRTGQEACLTHPQPDLMLVYGLQRVLARNQS